MSTAADRCSPVRGSVRVIAADGASAVTAVTVSPDEPVFEGHYPKFPIFPGVCVVECVHLSALATAPAAAGELRLSEIESTRFVSPVFPGDEVTTELKWTQDGDSWRCAAIASTSRGRAAQVRLRLSPRGSE